MRARLSYANVMASLALFVALGGTSYAAVTITGKNVKNRSLTGADVRSSSLTGKQIKNGSLSQVEFRFAPPTGAKGDTGATGPAGPTGPGSSAKGAEVDDQPLLLAPGADWKTIAELHTTTDPAPGLLQFSGAVEEASASKVATATVELRLVHNGHAHVLPSRNSVGIDEAEVGLAFFLCNELPGATDVLLQAQTTGAPVTIGRT